MANIGSVQFSMSGYKMSTPSPTQSARDQRRDKYGGQPPSESPSSPPIRGPLLNFLCGGVGGLAEFPIRSAIEVTKNRSQLDGCTSTKAFFGILHEKGPSGFFPFATNTATVRFFQRGGLYALTESNLDRYQKNILGFGYELLVTSINQVLTVNASVKQSDIGTSGLAFLKRQYDTFGVKGIVTPWLAARNLMFLEVYNSSNQALRDYRESNPILAAAASAFSATIISHIFDPSATFQTRYPATRVMDVPRQLYSRGGIKEVVGRGLMLRLASVGTGVMVSTAVGHIAKRAIEDTEL